MLKAAVARVGSVSPFQFLAAKSLFRAGGGRTGNGSNFVLPASLSTFDNPVKYSVRRSFSSNLQDSKAEVLKMATQTSSKSLEQVENALNNWLKPQLLGESWDNIGLLVGSGKYDKHEKVIERIMLCNDLTPAVLDEAISKKADMILAYHPPIFSGLKSISYGNWKERLIARCLANDISIYSPHTTLDSAIGGINDRVLSVFRGVGNNAESQLRAIIPSKCVDPDAGSLSFVSSVENISNILEKMWSQPDLKDAMISVQVKDSAVLIVYGESSFEAVLKMVKEMGLPDVAVQSEKPMKPIFGAGRIIELNEAVNLDDAVDVLKSHLGLGYVQLAYGGNPTVKTVAVCVGSGSSLLKPIAGKIDLLITGEMSHHDILACVHAKSSVVLCNHCSSERHYLPDLADILKVVTGLTDIFVSEEDASPLRLVL